MTPWADPVVTGLQCAVCGQQVDIAQPLSFTCPRATNDDRHHELQIVSEVVPFRPFDDPNPFIAFRRYLAVDAFGAAIGLPDTEREQIIRELNLAVMVTAGVGFSRTPITRADALSDELGFSATGGIWIKDETHNVGGSQKARYLFTELIHLVMAERAGVAPWKSVAERPPLAISSCGNAAIAASTLAAAMKWPIAVHVPTFASDTVLRMLNDLGAEVRVCERRESDPPGDPCVLRFREEVANGAIPFGVQGTENAWCLDGGRTIGWEIIQDIGHRTSRVFVQVGGGAFAATIGTSFQSIGVHPKLHAVQTEGCAPLARAYEHALATGGARNAGARWNECMWPWETEPHSIADGILDDETYDWLPILDAIADTDGSPVVASEANVVRAHELARTLTNIHVSATGSAGLAGLLQIRSEIQNDEKVVVIFSGIDRD